MTVDNTGKEVKGKGIYERNVDEHDVVWYSESLSRTHLPVCALVLPRPSASCSGGGRMTSVTRRDYGMSTAIAVRISMQDD